MEFQYAKDILDKLNSAEAIMSDSDVFVLELTKNRRAEILQCVGRYFTLHPDETSDVYKIVYGVLLKIESAFIDLPSYIEIQERIYPLKFAFDDKVLVHLNHYEVKMLMIVLGDSLRCVI